MGEPKIGRRQFIAASAVLSASCLLSAPAGASVGRLMRRIPSSGEAVPAVGLGTWITFNVGDDPALRSEAVAVMAAFFEAGGRLVDSSPMYGSSQAVIGHGLRQLGSPANFFSAEKVWTGSGSDGPAQIERSRRLWGVPRFDLVQVHNLVNWEQHLPTLRRMKEDGQVRYIGITTSHGRRHDLVEKLMRQQPLDFVQLTYNPVDREAEQRLLPLARDRGIAVIVNRPFQGGSLTERLAGAAIPPWAVEIGARSWAQLALKFILSHPAVTVVIPATTKVGHVRENVASASGPLPDEAMRARIAETIGRL